MIARGRSAGQRIRTIGLASIAHKLRLRLWSTRVALIVATETDPRPSRPPRTPLSFSVMPSDLVDVSEFGSTPLRGADVLYVEGLIKMYRKTGGEAVVARAWDGGLAGVGLMSFEGSREALDEVAPGLYHPLAADECWTEAHFVGPSHRNNGTMAGLLAEERECLRRRGVRKAYAVIDSSNLPSLRAFARAGYAPTGVIRVDRYRLNHVTSRFTNLDDRTRNRWQGVTVDTRVAH